MAVYLGNSKKLKIVMRGASYNLNVGSKMPSAHNVQLISSEGYILKDKNGLYLTTKEGK